MADKLTPQQTQAVQDRGGKLLVSAAAGSGKTKVLVDRLLGYLTDPKDPADLDAFLIITYTKAAASELRGKIAAKLTERIAQEPENRHLQKQMQRLFLTKISTVHGFCADVVREYAYRLDVAGDFRVADENECAQLRERVLSDLLDRAYERAGEDPEFCALIDTQGLGRDDSLVPQMIEQVYDSARCHLDPEGWLEECLAAAEADVTQDAGKTLWGRYLLEDLRWYLDRQIRVMTQCVRELEASQGMEKPAALYKDILEQLKRLRGAETWDQVVSGKDIAFGRLSFPRKNVDAELAERVKAARNACKKGLEKRLKSFTDDSAQVLSDLSQTADGVSSLIRLVKDFSKEYDAAKRGRRILDFSDLEHKMLDLLLGKSRSGSTAAAVEIGSRYREILVDEYQDSNGVQDAIFSALTGKRQNCFLVGDVKQSIYRFRLADPGIFLEKYHSYVPADQALPGQGRKVLLSHNFRSGAEVIEGVNHVFSCCMRPKVGGLHYGEAEALREGIPHQQLPDPGVELYALEVREDAYQEEAAFVAERIQAMIAQGTPVRDGDGFRPVQPEDIVILLRSPGSAGGVFQRALEARGIRCASGGGSNLLQTPEIETFRALLQIIQNPRQDIPRVAVLASPVFGFTADDLAAARGREKKGSIYDALRSSDLKIAGGFLDTFRQLRREARRCTLTQLLESCMMLTRLDSIYGAMADGAVRNANLQAFYQLAGEFEKGENRTLSQFLEHLELLEEKNVAAAGMSNAGCVTIMSIHKSKGLEFPVVFLANLSRKFNQEDLRKQILCDRELGMGLSAVDPKTRIRYPSLAKRAIAAKMAAESVSEEMRVLYVAMTRARDRLIMTYAPRNLEAELKDAALRMDFDRGELLCADAVCFGDWVMLAALSRREAGELHALGGRPKETILSDLPWKIHVAAAPEEAEAAEAPQPEAEACLPENLVEQLQKAIAFSYPYMAAAQAPSKQTATGRKGRVKDAEAAENTREPAQPVRTWRKPTFLRPAEKAAAVGTAMHGALQYLEYSACGSPEGAAREVARLVEQGFLTAEQGQLVDCGQLARFFDTPLGRRLRAGTPYVREFKFSILDDGSHYGEGLEGEQVLLQGVVDCALLEDDGITVIDFKTDRVTEQTLEDVSDRYRLQVQTYGEALSRIFEKPIKERFLYFFQLDRFVRI